MAVTNRERVDKALVLLREGLAPYVEREVERRLKRVPIDRIRRYNENPRLAGKSIREWDAPALLNLMIDNWREVFQDTLGHSGRNLAFELRDWRNKWAHQERFSSDDADRALDSAERMLNATSASQAAEVGAMKMDLRRLAHDEQVRSQTRRKAPRQLDAFAATGLSPWRDVVEPHADVATGRYRQAEFAADLGQVHRNEGVAEYSDPIEFFRRTYVTESLKSLLVAAIRRMRGGDGDPVVQLQTNFGGGKTHSMLALYHLFSGIDAQLVPNLEPVLAEAGVDHVDKVPRVVLVGTQISPGSPTIKKDGTAVNTLWGEIAYQLGGREAFERLRVDDERATSPGDRLRELLVAYGPCVILIDEWVSYARQLHDDAQLPGGTFETQFTFAQALSEAVKLTDNCMLMVSLPASDQATTDGAEIDDSEVGGRRGHDALERLRNVIARVESPWRPATAAEGFEIVRRRLFKPIRGDGFKKRDLTARAFTDLYRTQRVEFPAACDTQAYEDRIKATYPIHPEVFDRLYTDWSSLARFQRTRGVLRLMASVIHSLWESGDNHPLIQPWNFHLNNLRVRNELTRYLADNWAPVIEKDVDGDTALPLAVDGEVPNLGRLQAARRVARTIYLGSAPIADAARRGIEDTRLKLGCAMPGESPAVFGDALRRLAAKATYLYQDDTRYWYDTQPTIAKLARDRAEDLRRRTDRVAGHLQERLRQDLQSRGDFARVHTFPKSPSDVPDEYEARLVVLPPEAAYVKGDENPAQHAAGEILASRGAAPRLFRNTLAFLATDKARQQDLDEALRRFMAWDSIVRDAEGLGLAPAQRKQAETQRDAANDAVAARLPEAYKWLLVPVQDEAGSDLSWKPLSLTASGPLAERAGRRLVRDELLIGDLGPTVLRLHLDRVPLWRGDRVAVRQLMEDFAQYLYLPRLKGPDVLVGAVRAGVGLLTWEYDAFAYADGFDEVAGRYLGLRHQQDVDVGRDSGGLLVKPAIARAQIDIESPPVPPDPDPVPDSVPEPAPHPPPARVAPRRFHATATLNHGRIGPDASRIAEEVVSHLAGRVGAQVTVTLEIEVSVPDGVPEHVERVVTENSSSLRLDSHAFEES